jgi:hypothetical protein
MITRDSKMNLNEFEKPVVERMHLVEINPLLDDPGNSIYSTVFNYQRLRI